MSVSVDIRLSTIYDEVIDEMKGHTKMASPRKLLAVYREHKSGAWVATVQQGCLIERIVVIGFTNALDMDAPEREAEAHARAKELA
jgi:hypothetical protein